jgi:hypothetical protein
LSFKNILSPAKPNQNAISYKKPQPTPTKRRPSKLWQETVDGNVTNVFSEMQIKRQNVSRRTNLGLMLYYFEIQKYIVSHSALYRLYRRSKIGYTRQRPEMGQDALKWWWWWWWWWVCLGSQSTNNQFKLDHCWVEEFVTLNYIMYIVMPNLSVSYSYFRPYLSCMREKMIWFMTYRW